MHITHGRVWYLLPTSSYEDAVLKVVNFGGDAETSDAVTGALAGLLYGLDNTPPNWKPQLAKQSDSEELAERLGAKLAND